MKQLLLILLATAINYTSFSQNAVIDVQHYAFEININDSNNIIKTKATITLTITQPTSSIIFDLYNIDKDKKGMQVSSVSSAGKSISFTQEAEKLLLNFDNAFQPGETKVIEINYAGLPANGLIISKNKFGNRTIFAVNWPNRAHHWIACIDQQNDKATVEFMVIAPPHYQVISNGVLYEESAINAAQKLTHYKEMVPIPTKVMVIGLADFAVQYSGSVNCTPVYSWVYPKDREKGFYDYAIAKNILSYFNNTIGPYSYEKLANVQSTTMFGGMENAGAIFYGETTVEGNRSNEALLAHEIAHQWFGNSATEKSFEHLWLSEGFATYFTNLYLENKYGIDTLQKRLIQERDEAIVFSKKAEAPIVNPTEKYMSLLNAFSYQKGGWVLHMLRRKVGDALFWKAIQTYYATYRNSTATTDDLKNIFEKESHQILDTFFHQWLFEKSHPVLTIQWKYSADKKQVEFVILQTQEKPFAFPLDLEMSNDKVKTVRTINVSQKETRINIASATIPSKIIADPNTNLFFEWKMIAKK